MTTIALRDYQVVAGEAVEAAAGDGQHRVLVVLPTGTGKAAVFSEVIRRRGGRALLSRTGRVPA